MQNDPRRIDDLSLETGLEGLLHYILAHLQGAIIKNTSLPFDNTYLNDLYTTICTISSYKLNSSMRVLVKNYKKFYEEKENFHYSVSLATFTEKIRVSDKNIYNLPLGLRRGLAGYMLNSYINL